MGHYDSHYEDEYAQIRLERRSRIQEEKDIIKKNLVNVFKSVKNIPTSGSDILLRKLEEFDALLEYYTK